MRTVRLLLGAAAVSTPVLAHADVLEIAADGSVLVRSGERGVQWTPRAGATPAADPDAIRDTPGETHERALTIVGQPNIPAIYAAHVSALASRYDLSPKLIEALVWQESRWHANARSPVGARGLAQLMPATARQLGVNPADPLANLDGGARYLRQQLDRFDGNVEKALAAYNAGPGRVIRAGGIPRITETQRYVIAIVDRLSATPGR